MAKKMCLISRAIPGKGKIFSFTSSHTGFKVSSVVWTDSLMRAFGVCSTRRKRAVASVGMR